uniref:Putative transposable element n=1 Tax=Anopheles braziliensis TaxID=58242 RepID=A0A2M3ZBU8_9DIPT
MGRSQHLSFEEKIKIKSYHDAGLSSREIGRKIHRAHTAVGNYLKNGDKHKRIGKRGKKSMLSSKDTRRIRRLATNQKRTASQIRAKLELSVTLRRVQQVLSSTEHLEWRERLGKPKLTDVAKNTVSTSRRNTFPGTRNGKT